MTLRVATGSLLLTVGIAILVLKVSVARSYADNSGGGAPLLDGALLFPLLAVWGFSLLAPQFGLVPPFPGFWVLILFSLVFATGGLLSFLSRPRSPN